MTTRGSWLQLSAVQVLAVDVLRQERAVSSGHDHTCRVWKIPDESQLIFRSHGMAIDCCKYITGTTIKTLLLTNTTCPEWYFAGGQPGAHGLHMQHVRHCCNAHLTSHLLCTNHTMVHLPAFCCALQLHQHPHDLHTNHSNSVYITPYCRH